MHSLPHYQHPPSDATFVTGDEPTLTHHHHPESVVYMTIHSWCCHSVNVNKLVMTCIHHYSNMYSNFTALILHFYARFSVTCYVCVQLYM